MAIGRILFWLLFFSPTLATQDMRAVDQRQYYPIPSTCYSEVERPYLFTGTKVVEFN